MIVGTQAVGRGAVAIIETQLPSRPRNPGRSRTPAAPGPGDYPSCFSSSRSEARPAPPTNSPRRNPRRENPWQARHRRSGQKTARSRHSRRADQDRRHQQPRCRPARAHHAGTRGNRPHRQRFAGALLVQQRRLTGQMRPHAHDNESRPTAPRNHRGRHPVRRVFSVNLATAGIKLEVDRDYQWSISSAARGEPSSLDIVSQGRIRRVAAPPALTAQLAAHPPRRTTPSTCKADFSTMPPPPPFRRSKRNPTMENCGRDSTSSSPRSKSPAPGNNSTPRRRGWLVPATLLQFHKTLAGRGDFSFAHPARTARRNSSPSIPLPQIPLPQIPLPDVLVLTSARAQRRPQTHTRLAPAPIAAAASRITSTPPLLTPNTDTPARETNCPAPPTPRAGLHQSASS